MDVEPFELGASGLVVGGVLAILVAAVVGTLLVLLMWTIALTVVAPAMGSAAAEARRSKKRAWLQEVRDSWLADPGELEEPSPPAGERPAVRGVGVVCTQDAGALTQLVAGQLTPTGTAVSGFASMAIVRATVKPDHQLELPAHPHCNLGVYVLAGRGTVGSQRQAVRAGQVALHGRRSPIRVAALSEHRRPLEILVVPQVPTEQPLVADEPAVMQMSADVRHQFRVLEALMEDLPTPQEVRIPVQPAAQVLPTRPPLPTAVPAA